MCIQCNEKNPRRNFLSKTFLAAAGLLITNNSKANKNYKRLSGSFSNQLNDIISQDVSFVSDNVKIPGFLSRPKQEGKYKAILIQQGNPGVSSDISFAATRLALEGFVCLVYDWGARAPMPNTTREDFDKWSSYLFSNEFFQIRKKDYAAAIEYLYSLPYVENSPIGLVGFCMGGRDFIIYSSTAKYVKSVVSFYGPVRGNERKHKTDPIVDIPEIIDDLKIPIQGHYGKLDLVSLQKDTSEFEQAMKNRKHNIEIYYYENAGHSFCNFNTPQGTRPNSGFNFESAIKAYDRTARFLKSTL